MSDHERIKSEAVQACCEAMWDRRERGDLPPAGELARMLAVAVADDVATHRRYDPEADQRVAWARTLIRELRRQPERRPQADGDSEAIAAWLLDRMPKRQGKDLALADF